MKSRFDRWSLGAGKYNEEQLNKRKTDYNNNPDKCLFCKTEMIYISLAERKERKFCSKSCAAKHNNYIRLQTNFKYQKGLTKETNCSICQIIIIIAKNASAIQAKCFNCKNKIKQLKIKTCKSCNKQFQDCAYRFCCSSECLNNLRKTAGSLGGRKSASKNIKRSKDEIELYNLCKSYFKSVRHNQIIKDGWDADIIVDDYKIAILWNGPWHYKQLNFKNHSLSQVQNRDRIKNNVLSESGWEVITFNDNEFKPIEAFNFLKEKYKFNKVSFSN